MREKDHDEFVRDIASKVKDMPLLGLFYINKVVSEELLERCMLMAEEAFEKDK